MLDPPASQTLNNCLQSQEHFICFPHASFLSQDNLHFLKIILRNSSQITMVNRIIQGKHFRVKRWVQPAAPGSGLLTAIHISSYPLPEEQMD